jgi:uroporphyrinogen decarboxylase
MSIDWTLDLDDVARACPGMPLQGNMDPIALYGTPDTVRESTRRVLASARGLHHVFNLGHGILPDVPVENAIAMVDEVKGWK